MLLLQCKMESMVSWLLLPTIWFNKKMRYNKKSMSDDTLFFVKMVYVDLVNNFHINSVQAFFATLNFVLNFIVFTNLIN